MSVGVQRLRAEPEVIRKGALDKGEDAALVDVALALDTRRRALLGEADARKAERNAASKQIGEAIKGGAAPPLIASPICFEAALRSALRASASPSSARRRVSSASATSTSAASSPLSRAPFRMTSGSARTVS